MKFLVGVDGSSTPTQPALYLVEGARAANLSQADASLGSDLLRLIERGSTAATDVATIAATASWVDAASIRPTLPIARPSKIVCLGLNYVDHAKEGGYDVPTYPALFLRVASSLTAAEQPLIRPRASETFDYEAELMAIIGRGGRHIAEEDALDHIFGYTIFNDGSVREYQRKTHQWTAGKNFDATGAVGPIVVTPDELPPGAAGLSISTRLNGATLQDADTSDMIFPTARTIALLSEIMTLEPGDLIALGTPPGVGHARRPQVWMKPGDEVEVEIEGIGVCRNPIVAEETTAEGRAA